MTSFNLQSTSVRRPPFVNHTPQASLSEVPLTNGSSYPKEDDENADAFSSLLSGTLSGGSRMRRWESWTRQPRSFLARQPRLFLAAVVTALLAAVAFGGSHKLQSFTVGFREDRPLHAIFPMNEAGFLQYSDLACKVLLAAIVHGYAPIIINWQTPVHSDSEDPAQYKLKADKMPAVARYMDEHMTAANDNDYLLMADAFDFWLQLSPAVLLRRFRELKTGVVVGVDGFCWPNDPTSPECLAVPHSPVPVGVFGNTTESGPRWANSGSFIGTVKEMRIFFKAINQAMEERPKLIDQGALNTVMPRSNAKPDYWYRMFWTTSSPGGYVIMPIARPLEGDVDQTTTPWREAPPMVFHTLTGEVPVALHFNEANSKSWYMSQDVVWGKVWWSMFDDARFRDIIATRLRRGSVSFAHNGTRLSFGEMCPLSILGMRSVLLSSVDS